jgi:ABC-type branched-subunit amino acid transport system permease subunit
VIGLAGAMMVTLDGQLTPGSFNPLRYTFLIWLMVIVGGSGNNWGAVLGAILIWFLWIKVECLDTETLPDRQRGADADHHHGCDLAAGAEVQSTRAYSRTLIATVSAGQIPISSPLKET